MIFSRVYTFFFMLVSFGSFFVAAGPVAAEGKLAARYNPFSDLVDVVVGLKADLAADLLLLDGVHDPSTDIVAKLNAATAVLADIHLDVNTPIVQADVNVAVSAIVDIILGLVAGLGKYGILGLFASLAGDIDLALAAFVTANINVLGLIQLDLIASLTVDVLLLLAVKLVLTIAAIGLHI